MTHRMLRDVALVALLLLPAGWALAQGAGGLKFHADLSAAQEVPGPVQSSASARTRVFFDRALSRVQVQIDIKGELMVIGAHFHCGRAGTNGPVAFGILNPGPLFEVGARTRVTLSNEDFTGADCVPDIGRPVNNIAALALAMRDGLIYLNLHTPSAPAGELRGQLLEVGP